MSEKPIGVFDSGFGGLSVLQALVEAFPLEKFIYLGDTARIPYGVKSAKTVAKYLQQNLQFLKKLDCKAVVVACNTASAVLNPQEFSFPVIGVIEPGAALAAQQTKNLRVGVMATQGTVLSKSYVTKIQTHNSEIQVFQKACPLLVPLVEENWIDDPITNLIVYRYLAPLVAEGIDTLVLGCTHYPFLIHSVQRVTGDKISIVRSGSAVALALREALAAAKISAAEDSQNKSPVRLLTTDNAITYVEMAKRFTKGLDITELELVEI